jgi:diguanylate cyclase (GGDEF)-like protein
MIHIRVQFLIVVITCLLMAVSLWVSMPGQRERGFAKLTLSLALAAVAFALFAAHDSLTGAGTVLASAALLSTLVLGGDAILEFQKRKLHWVWYVVPPIAIAVCSFVFFKLPVTRLIATGSIFAIVIVVLAGKVARGARAEPYHSYRLIVGGAVIAAVLLIARNFVGLALDIPASEAPESDWFWILTFFAAFTNVVTATLGFILLHKERAEAEVRALAMTDSLTGIYNRRMFFEFAEKEIGRARRTQSPLSLMMIDLDHFKVVNDTYGHVAGDMVLKHVVGVVVACLRVEDLFVRFGGEEFCVLAAGICSDDAQLLAERVRKSVAHSPPSIEGKRHAITVSIGLATLVPAQQQGISTLIEYADAAMYEAKRAGRNRVVQHQ